MEIHNEELLKIDLQYFANVYWYKKLNNYKHIEISLYERHVKMSFRNRLWVAGAEGRMNLSVPIVDGRNERQWYKDVRIVPGRWQMIHFRALVSCYNRSPWFEHYRDELAELYERPFEFLWDWNLACHEWISKKVPFKGGQIYQLEAGKKGYRPPTGGAIDSPNSSDRKRETGVDFRNFFKPSGNGNWQENGEAAIRYAQVFEERTGFIPGLSILDLLFCEGPNLLKKLG